MKDKKITTIDFDNGVTLNVESDNVFTIVFDEQTRQEYLKHYFKTYPRRKKEPIDSPIHPSINKWFIMDRPQMNALKQSWKEFTMWIVEQQGFKDLNIKKAVVIYRYYFKTRVRQDVDNRICKFVNDGLIESNVFFDDCYSVVNPMILWGGYDKENPRMEITVIRLDT